jgi:putative Mn2+ efflux pump MntP
MDACAVSICKGLSVRRVEPKHMLICGAYFGGFQALMPLIGYLLGVNFQSLITSVDHWIAFVLLGLIGMNMIRESRSGDEEEGCGDFGFKTMLMMAVATSIDALAVGITFAFLNVNIVPAVCFIGITAFALSAGGVVLGNVFGSRWKSRAEFAGGLILVCMGAKILIEHLFFG